MTDSAPAQFMARKKGTVTQGTLDWYALRAQSAQQWFSNNVASYWVFSLFNQSNDGSMLWLYDVSHASGLVLPPGTGNPGGNPNAQAGSTPPAGTVSAFQFINSQRNAGSGPTGIGGTYPAAPVKGNLFLLLVYNNGGTPAQISVADPGFVFIGGVTGNAGCPGIGAWAKIATGTESGPFGISSSAGNIVIGYEVSQWSGNANPGASDVFLGQVSVVNNTSPTAPAVTTTAAGDLAYATFSNTGGGGNFSAPPGTTSLGQFVSSGIKWIGAYIRGVNQGVNGPYVGSDNSSEAWAALTVTLKAAITSSAPAQTLSNPIQTTGGLAGGILTMQYATSPIGFPGVTKWVPPNSAYSWHREAPIAIVRQNNYFNLAGIAPEYSAWCDMTWVAIK